MRVLPVAPLLALLVTTSLGLTACKGADDAEPTDDSRVEGDADADADSDTDTDSDADSDAQKEECLTEGDEDKDGLADCQDPDCTAYCVEDCGDTLDNDQDGLTDCADDDCLDACVEDCSDTVDNDADGAIDCDDDECNGSEACPTIFSLEAKVTLEEAIIGWGAGLYYYFGVTTLGLTYGEVQLYGASIDGTGPSFTCTGQLYAYPAFYGVGYGVMEQVAGDCDGCDLRFEMTTSVANGGLRWRGKCPVSALPTAQLGFFYDRYELTRYDPTTATWNPHYSAAYGRLISEYSYYGYGMTYYSFLSNITTLNSVVWEAPL